MKLSVSWEKTILAGSQQIVKKSLDSKVLVHLQKSQKQTLKQFQTSDFNEYKSVLNF